MKEFFVLILKSLLWVFIMLLLRPLNSVLDACISKYIMFLDTDECPNFQRVNWTAIKVFFVVVSVIFIIIKLLYLYG